MTPVPASHFSISLQVYCRYLWLVAVFITVNQLLDVKKTSKIENSSKISPTLHKREIFHYSKDMAVKHYFASGKKFYINI